KGSVIVHQHKAPTLIHRDGAVGVVFHDAVEIGDNALVLNMQHQMVLSILPGFEAACPVFRQSQSLANVCYDGLYIPVVFVFTHVGQWLKNRCLSGSFLANPVVVEARGWCHIRGYQFYLSCCHLYGNREWAAPPVGAAAKRDNQKG